MKKLFVLILTLISCLSLFCISFSASAQVGSNMVRVDSLASQFAMQAGTIAGVVQACGQNIVEYNSRVVSAVNALAKTPQEQMQAMTDYQKALSTAQQTENRTHSINCDEATKSFNGLPLMQPDYKTTVLPQLRKMGEPQSFEARAAEAPAKLGTNPTAKFPATSVVTPTTPGY